MQSPAWTIRGSLTRKLYWSIAAASFCLWIAAWWAATALHLVEHTQDLKRSPAFLAAAGEILDRIRATSGLQSDLDALRRLTGHAMRAVTAVM